MSDFDEKTLTVSGIKVTFPCKPYPAQIGMMDRVIKGLERRQNSLLESPTGSGKSLALLCSSLAWQVAQYERAAREGLETCAGDYSQPCHCGAAENRNNCKEYSPESKPGFKDSQGDSDNPVDLSNDGEEDDDFKPTASKLRTPNFSKEMSKKRRHLGVQYEDDEGTSTPPEKCTCKSMGKPDPKKKDKVPKIYFGTRTHKQIAQITRELRKTAYHDVRMVILASREYTCVHPDVTKLKNKSEGCRERLDILGPGCRFNDKAKRVFLSQKQLQEELTTAWDLEDFVGSCNSKKACPYFVTKNIVQGADIIFCPYNYLIDPLVRKSMEINLKDQVVILDEAHNMEDCARDAGSGSITTDQITGAIQNLQELLEHNIKYVEHLKLRNMLESLLNFIEGNNSNLDQMDYDTSYKVWSGFDIVVRLKGIGLGPDTFQEYQRCFEQAVAQSEDEQVSVRDRRNKEIKMASSTQQILEQLFQILDYMYRNDLKFVEDYRVAIMKSMQFVSHRDTNDRWLGKNRRGGSRITVYTLNFWCMNPAVAFSDFSVCRNVVLSSGTLSPMNSFASELGTPFPIQLEANHVIEDKQVWVGSVGVGPSGQQLQAVYRNMETYSFQDELGNLILQICTKIPHGVLCFLPSYRALQKFTERWKLTGLWDKLRSRKRVMVEPRAVDREDFDGMMKAFYEVVKGDLYNDHMNEEDCVGDDSEIDGALFFAVCRGKVSEGMDFADNNARAVITVGIPYPSIKDVQVKLKREYNDKHKADRGLLSGNEWYEIQAFRALNQALGRCIRHRKDWGALIIVDDRFVKRAAQYCKSLSRWVRSKVQTFEAFPDFLSSVSSFTEKMIKEMPVINPDTSFIPSTPGNFQRESFYRRDSAEYSVQGSPYFSSPPMSQLFSQPKVPKKTPDSHKRGRKGSNSVPGSPAFTSPTLQNQMTSLSSQQIVSPTIQHQMTLTQQNTALQQVAAASSINQQVMNIINSGTAPKDQPYYIILNQGTANEQTFLIEPNKLTGAVPGQMQTPVMLPSTAQAGQQICIAGTSNQQVLLTDAHHIPQGTSLLTGATSLLQNQGTSLLQNAKSVHNKQSTSLITKPESNVLLSKPPDVPSKQQTSKPLEKKAEMVFTLSPSSLTAEEQLKKFVNSGQAPRDKAYFVVVNKGTPNEKAFFIEPSKKEKPQDGENKKHDLSDAEQSKAEDKVNRVDQTDPKSVKQSVKTEHEVTAHSEQHLANQPVRTETDISKQPIKTEQNVTQEPDKIEQEVVAPDSSTDGDPDPQNKFLRFCHLSKTPAKVPVATVPPQRPGASENDSGPRVKPDTTASNEAESSLMEAEVKPSRVTSPDLFDSQAQSKLEADNASVDQEAKKKPIFKKRTPFEQKKIETKSEAAAVTRDILDDSNEAKSRKTDKANETELSADVKTDQTTMERSGNRKSDRMSHKKETVLELANLDFKPKRSRSLGTAVRGEVNRHVAEQLKQCRRKSAVVDSTAAAADDDKPDTTNTMAPAADKQENSDTEDQSDEDFLNTRRRGGRKRKTTSRYAEWAKRTKKGMKSDDQEDRSEGKENMQTGCLTCSKCSKTLVTSEQYQRQKKYPDFLMGIVNKTTDVLYLTSMKLDTSALKPVSAQTDMKGVTLNAQYYVDSGCCIQYLQCKSCDTVIGARVLFAEPTSDFKVGQTWILSSAVNL